MANCVVSDQTLLTVASDRGLHGLFSPVRPSIYGSTAPHQPGLVGQDLCCLTYITKTYLYYFDPLKPHFYTVKLGFTGVNLIFLISAQNIDCGYSLEPPRRGGSNEYSQSMF